MSFLRTIVSAVLVIAGAIVGGPWGAAMMLAATAVNVYDAKREAKKAKQRQLAAYNASLTDRLETVQAETAARRIILGKVRVGGVIADATSTGTNKEKLFLTVLLAGHRVQSIDDIWLDEQKLTLDSNGIAQEAPYMQGLIQSMSEGLTPDSTGAATVLLAHTPIGGSVSLSYQTQAGIDGDTVTDVSFTLVGNTLSVSGLPPAVSVHVNYQYNIGIQHVRVYKFDGTHTAVPALLAAAAPAKWTSAHKLLGQAFIVLELVYNTDVFPRGLPKVSATVSGALVFDPRTSTTAWSDNPALLLAHYATHPLGGRLPSTAPDTSMLIAAANVCDTMTSMYVTRDSSGTVTSSATAKLFTAGIMADSDRTPSDIMDELAESMSGRWCVSGGELLMRSGALGSTVATINEDWLAGGITVRAQRPRQELANTVRGTFSSDQANYQPTQFSQVQDATMLAAHGAELLQEVQFEAVTRGPQCQFLATIMLREMRQGMIVTLKCNLRAYPLQPFDVVSLTLGRYGWSSKLFEVVDRTFDVEGGVLLSLRETASAIYDQTLTLTTDDPAPNTLLPSPFVVPRVTGVAVTSGTSTLQLGRDGSVIARALVTWDAVASEAVTQSGKIEIKYGLTTVPESEWALAEVLGADTQVYLSPVVEGRAYVFKARAVSKLVRGTWSAQVVHVIVGKSEPPSDVTALVVARRGDTLSFAWNAITDLDRGGYQIRRGDTWETGVIVATAARDATTATATSPRGGTYLIKAVDTSGNFSANPVAAIVSDVSGINAVIAYDFGSAIWPGSRDGLISYTLFEGSPTWETANKWGSFSSSWLTMADKEGLRVGSGIQTGVYTTTAVDIGYVSSAVVSIDASVMTLGQSNAPWGVLTQPWSTYTWPWRSSASSGDIGSGYEISTSLDNVQWSDWRPFVAGEYTARYYKLRVTLTGPGSTFSSAPDGPTPFLAKLVLNIDVPDRVLHFADLSVPPGGATIQFSPPFIGTPTIQATLQSAVATDTYTLTGKSNAGVTIQVLDGSGIPKAGLVDIDAFGYGERY